MCAGLMFALTVAQNPDSISPVSGIDGASWKHGRPAGVANGFQIRKCSLAPPPAGGGAFFICLLLLVYGCACMCLFRHTVFYFSRSGRAGRFLGGRRKSLYTKGLAYPRPPPPPAWHIYIYIFGSWIFSSFPNRENALLRVVLGAMLAA